MAIKLEIKGNFLHITDPSTNEVERLIKSFTTYDFIKGDKILTIRSEQGTNQVSYQYNIFALDGTTVIIEDSTDTPFVSLAALGDFLDSSLGFNLGGGSGVGTSVTENVAVTHSIDWDINNHNLTMTANTVFTESNLPPLGVEKTITVYLYGLFSPTDVLAWGIIGQPYDGVNGSQIVVHWKGDGTYHAVRNDLA